MSKSAESWGQLEAAEMIKSLQLVNEEIYSQSLLRSREERLAEALVLRDGLQDVALEGDVPDRPLAQPGAAQPEHVAAGETK